MRCKFSWKLIIFWTLCIDALAQEPTPLVRVQGGTLRGTIALDGSHARYTGIPYATVKKRFQAAIPNPQWQGVFDANNDFINCPQRLLGFVIGQEDCLVLNVYTPLPREKTTLLPVIVFIHGGSFRSGSACPLLYGPDYLVQHDVILVTLNYRLEVLGFLCLGIEEAPGNIAMKDQTLALKWVKENIKAFGGDPNRVTLGGESAGSASVLYHMISPMSRGLFNKAIMQSGSAISYWAFQYDPLEAASQLAEQFGHYTKNAKELYNLFVNLPVNELVAAHVPRPEGNIYQSDTIFVPCVEKELPGIERFLTDLPYNLISRGQYTKVPIIMGFNSEEGLTFLGQENATTIAEFEVIKSLPRDLLFPSYKEAKRVADKLKKMYFENKASNELLQLSRYEGDTGIRYPVISTTQLLLDTNEYPIYSYELTYYGLLNIVKFVSGYGSFPGVAHADDLFYLFKTVFPLPVSQSERDIINKLSTLWTNFAKFGDPTPSVSPELPQRWAPADRNNPHQLVINEKLSTAPLWEDPVILYWNYTYAKYRRPLWARYYSRL